MKIPKKIKISGIDYEVKIIEVGEVPPLMSNHADGQTSHDTCKIYLDKALNKQRMSQIFIHEILHAIEWNNDFESPENYIQAMASGLYQVLKDNKLLRSE